MYSKYLHYAIMSIIGGLGIVGGILLGQYLIGQNSLFADSNQRFISDFSHNRSPGLQAGDMFPGESFTYADGSAESFENLLLENETILLFIDSGSLTCGEMLLFWEEFLEPNALESIHLQLVSFSDRENLGEEMLEIVGVRSVIYVDRNALGNEYDLFILPLMISIDKYGFMTGIQQGFNEMIDRGILEFVLGPAGMKTVYHINPNEERR